MNRHVVDGNGVERHLAGLRWAPKDPRRLMRVAPTVPGAPNPETFIDVPIFDQIPIFDQGQIGRCTGETQSRLSSALVLKQTGKLVLFSSMFMYAVSRKDEGTPLTEDSGCAIPDVQASWEKHGIAPHDADPEEQDFTREPSDEAKAAAAQYKGLIYCHCPDHVTIHASLAAGFGLSIGIAVPENMMSDQCAKDGKILLPEPGEKIEGGHDITLRAYVPDMVVGKSKGAYVIDNSWSEDWGGVWNGRRGHAFLPKDFLLQQLASDAECPRAMMVPA